MNRQTDKSAHNPENFDTQSKTDAFAQLANDQVQKSNAAGDALPNHSHAWRGTWNRPMHLDENTQHPFTIARMTDHNVRGTDR